MKNKKLKKFLSGLIIIFGLYSLTKINSYNERDSLQQRQKVGENSTDKMNRHLLMPSNFESKKLPFHQVYESRKIGYPPDIKVKNKNSAVSKIILLWTPWNGLEKTINYYFLQSGNRSFVKHRCPEPKCITTRNRKYLHKADAVLFHLLDIKISDLPLKRTKEQVWILYNLEAPWLIKKKLLPDLKFLKSVFNWTMTYRSDSDVVARYGFIAASNEQKPQLHINKTRSIVWFVSDCNTDSKREDYVNELKKYIDVDIYGTCGDKKCYPSQSSTCYENILKNYKFYLSFENAICNDYVTEKFFNIYNYDIIPVVFGGADYSTIAPKDTFIDATTYLEPKLLANVLLKIDNDAYKQIMLKKQLFRAYLDPWMCRLCSVLHAGEDSTSVLEDVEDWWLGESECKIWDKSKFKFVDVK